MAKVRWGGFAFPVFRIGLSDDGKEIEAAAKECAIPPDSLHMGGPPVDNVAIDVEGERTLYRLREGIERFMITDINNPAASATITKKTTVHSVLFELDIRVIACSPCGVHESHEWKRMARIVVLTSEAFVSFVVIGDIRVLSAGG